MHLIQLKPYYFRSFGDNSPINFADDITIFYGGNGSGKSSLAESLEWLFYGYTKRRRKGDQYSRNEYKGSYINTGCPNGVAPFVEAQVLLSDRSKHVLRRVMKIDDRGRVLDTESTVLIDNVEEEDFSSLGITSDAYCPIVVQHGIQDFIHTRPIDRYRIISEALGLSELTKFKDTLEQAKNRFKSNPPQKISEASAALKRSVKALEKTGLKSIATRWQKGEVDEPADSNAIFQKAHELTGSQADKYIDLLGDVKNRQALEISKLFNIAPYRPNPEIEKVLQQIPNLLINISKEYGNVLIAASDLAKCTVLKYSELQLTFWTQGITLLSQTGSATISNSDYFECPFCAETTVTKIKLDELKTRSSSGNGLNEKREQFKKATYDLESILNELESLWPQIELATITDKDVLSLKSMFSRGEKRLEDFAESNNKYSQIIHSFKIQVNELKLAIRELRKNVVNTEKVLQTIKPLDNFVQNLIKTQKNLEEISHNYSTVFSNFYPILQRELSDEQTVAVFTSLVDLLTTKPQIELVILGRDFYANILKCQQVADSYILQQQKDILGSREQDILNWYGRLSPNQDVKFSGLEPGKNEFNLKATAFGKELNAAASLSQSQLNCLGLSVYIPSILAPDAPFHFIVFDDPVQAMDDEHHEAFLIKVIPDLLEIFKRQVIVLTHLKPTADRLRGLNYDRCPIYYRLDKLAPNGPQIREYVALKEEAKQIKELAEGNEENRTLSADRVRVLCEIVMREAHLKINGIPMPSGLLTAGQMLPAFRKLKGVTPSIFQQIEDTIKWSDPSHHTDPDWQVPDSSAIKIHVDRLQSIIGNLKLYCD